MTPTIKYARAINSAVNKCVNLFDAQTRRRIKNINPKAPAFRGLPKLHKPNIPIRPLINHTTAPSYNVCLLYTSRCV